ncbi:hypothetical protein GX441_07745 [bacterium]|nr:hypothetical protein [bacterium]
MRNGIPIVTACIKAKGSERPDAACAKHRFAEGKEGANKHGLETCNSGEYR